MDLGRQSRPLTLHLARDAGFTQNLIADADYPAGAVWTLVITTEAATVTTWTATVAGDTATFSETLAEVNTVLDVDGPKTAYLYYDETGFEPVLVSHGPVRGVRA